MNLILQIAPLFYRAMKQFMKENVETCQDLLFITDIQTANASHMVNLSR